MYNTTIQVFKLYLTGEVFAAKFGGDIESNVHKEYQNAIASRHLWQQLERSSIFVLSLTRTWTGPMVYCCCTGIYKVNIFLELTNRSSGPVTANH